MSQPLYQTLTAIRIGFPCTASEIYGRLRQPKLDRSAVNQRVKKLVKLGLVKTKKQARSLRLYSLSARI